MNQTTTPTTRKAATMIRSALFALTLSGVAFAPLAAQAEPDHHNNRPAACRDCGTVISTRTYEEAAKSGNGVGAIGGAVVGGLLGNHVGGGNGRALATVAGAVGGGYAGNAVEKRVRTTTYTDVRVRMSNGNTRTFKQEGTSHYRNGAPVRVVNGGLEAR